mmetsp:Transcript_35862/g.33965  ORF Transcript_35862/g.33965 Transcript_35862/m.33965 type:complete len:506 (+) Transcript_35862:229-1746(+)|eukprot:CAMPEP_0119039250 /NCGR_PEP_ID=MMETSP1177-20130426/8650_1 /TAXON_ID=2985 /ORGANISM="Ochromonas sp, Strain CCMP1899" /LENGTH=505 /DNA_ID=CAMNT_0007002909 /DNA_START=212 /DNA_END=1729 /DNA_ORIENTATION=-
MSSKTASFNQNSEDGEGFGLDLIIQKMRKIFPDKSRKGLIKAFSRLIAAVYKKASDSANIITNYKSLNLIEFKIAIAKNFKGKLVLSEIKEIFSFFDSNKNGRVELEEFINGIRGNLTEDRQQIVNFIFHHLDRNASGFIEDSELTTFYRKSLLPDIISGQSDPAIKSSEFFKKIGCSDGKVSLEQLTDYYLSKSIKINNDVKFKSDCMDEWLLKEEDADTFLAYQLTPHGKSPLRHRGLSMCIESGGSILGGSVGGSIDVPTNIPANMRRRFTEQLNRGSSFRSISSRESVNSLDFNSITPSTLLTLKEEGGDEGNQQMMSKSSLSISKEDSQRSVTVVHNKNNKNPVSDDQSNNRRSTESLVSINPASSEESSSAKHTISRPKEVRKTSFLNLSPRTESMTTSSRNGSSHSVLVSSGVDRNESSTQPKDYSSQPKAPDTGHPSSDQVNTGPSKDSSINSLQVLLNSLELTCTDQLRMIESQDLIIDSQANLIKELQIGLGWIT